MLRAAERAKPLEALRLIVREERLGERRVCAREERPRGVGAIEYEQALGDLLEDVPVRRAEYVELRQERLMRSRIAGNSVRCAPERMDKPIASTSSWSAASTIISGV